MVKNYSNGREPALIFSIMEPPDVGCYFFCARTTRMGIEVSCRT